MISRIFFCNTKQRNCSWLQPARNKFAGQRRISHRQSPESEPCGHVVGVDGVQRPLQRLLQAAVLDAALAVDVVRGVEGVVEAGVAPQEALGGLLEGVAQGECKPQQRKCLSTLHPLRLGSIDQRIQLKYKNNKSKIN